MLKKILKIVIIICLLGITYAFLINLFVCKNIEKRILKLSNFDKNEKYDAIIVLGAGVWGDSPSPLLKDILNKSIEVYKSRLSNKIIMSGDHGRINYDEVNIMKEYAIKEGVPSEDIFMDHAGFSTYETIYRARDIFKVKKAIIVTQKYHLYRSLYISKKLGLDVVGIEADYRQYSDAYFREAREVLARNKDFLKCIFKPKPTYLGNEIPVSGNGNITNDKKS